MCVCVCVCVCVCACVCVRACVCVNKLGKTGKAPKKSLECEDVPDVCSREWLAWWGKEERRGERRGEEKRREEKRREEKRREEKRREEKKRKEKKRKEKRREEKRREEKRVGKGRGGEERRERLGKTRDLAPILGETHRTGSAGSRPALSYFPLPSLLLLAL